MSDDWLSIIGTVVAGILVCAGLYWLLVADDRSDADDYFDYEHDAPEDE